MIDRASPSATTRRVLLLAYDGVDDLDFFGARSVLAKAARIAAEQAAPALVTEVSGPSDPFPTSSGMTIEVPSRAAGTVADAIVVPGGTGAPAAARSHEMRAALRAFRAGGARFYTICSGALLLAEAGLLDGRRVAIHSSKRELLSGSGCREVVAGLCRDGWLTSVGGEPSRDVKSVLIGFRLLEDLTPDLVEPVRRRMEISAR